VEAGGLERFGSARKSCRCVRHRHNGSDQHRAIVLGMLQKLGLGADALQCGAGYPLQLKLFGKYPAGRRRSGSAAPQLLGQAQRLFGTGQAARQPLDTYLEPTGPAQSLVRQAVAANCEVAADSLLLGTDGCSAPNFALPLRSLAVGFKNLALASDGARARVRDAMLENPLLVSGERRLDYDLSLAFSRPGRRQGRSRGAAFVGVPRAGARHCDQSGRRCAACAGVPS